jgi:hypothetical protein
MSSHAHIAGRAILVSLTVWALAMIVPDFYRVYQPLGSFGFYGNNDGLITDVQAQFPGTPLSREYMHGAAMLDCRIVDVPDAKSAPAEFSAGAQNFLASGNRAITIMPMIRRDEAIGLLTRGMSASD